MALNLPDSPRKIVFRTLVGIFQGDPDLRRAIRPASWTVWKGESTETTPQVSQSRCPVAQLLPVALPATAETEAAQNSPFGISLYVATWGTNLDDLLDLWSAFERSIFSGDGSRPATDAIRAALLASPGCAGASIQTIRLGIPAIQPVMEDTEFKYMVATGTIFIQMLVRK